MTENEELPTKIPLVSVSGAVVFSDTNLPIPMNYQQYEQLLFISEPTNYTIGIVQPKSNHHVSITTSIPLFRSGTAVRIIDAFELDDHMMAVQVRGLCRFMIENEFIVNHKYRFADVSYTKYIYADSLPLNVDQFDKESFIGLAKKYMNQHSFYPDWKDLMGVSPIELVNFLTMIGPFDPAEKQAILEVPDPNEQKHLMERIMMMSLSKSSPISTLKH